MPLFPTLLLPWSLDFKTLDEPDADPVDNLLREVGIPLDLVDRDLDASTV